MSQQDNRLPLVSVIVTTRNNHATLEACLASIAAQTYGAIELIVVDNNSEDDTRDIAWRHTPHVFNKPPERSVQRNYGVSQANGTYVCIIDSDMELTPDVIAACVEKATENPEAKGIIIPEQSFGQGFWAQCKRLERSFYVGVDWVEAARFFDRATYLQVGGYDESMVSGEDWDLSRRAAAIAPLLRVDTFIHHNEGRLQLMNTLKKKVYYAGQARKFLAKNPVGSKMTAQEGPLARYKLFLSRPGKLLRNPLIASGMLFMKTCEFGFGAYGYVKAGREERTAQQ